jgi:hypothetical protein
LDILVPEGTVSLFFLAKKKKEPLLAGANKHFLKQGLRIIFSKQGLTSDLLFGQKEESLLNLAPALRMCLLAPVLVSPLRMCLLAP